MLQLILNLIISAIVLLITAAFVPGFDISGFVPALIACVVIGFMNFLIRPLIMLLTLPINLMTLGLFSFVINALLLNIAAGLIDGFSIETWWAAIFGSIVLSIVQIIINFLTPGSRKLFG